MFNLKLIPLEERIVLDAAAAAVIYVNIHTPATPSHETGANWAHAWNNLQSALTEAQTLTGPVQIWVAKGTYTPAETLANPTSGTDPTATFNLPNNVSLYGGFAGNETSLNQRNPTCNITVLSGDLLGNDLPGNPYTASSPAYLASIADNTNIIITANNVTATLDGFTVSGANNNDTGDGGGLFGSNDHLTLNNMKFINNTVDYDGGGIWISNSTLTVSNSVFTNDTTGYGAGGGAIYLLASTETITNDLFNQDISLSVAGGIAAQDTSSTISNSCFVGCGSIQNDSAALWDVNYSPGNYTTTISYCEFLNNYTLGGVGAGAINSLNLGGATHTLNIDHSDFNGNSATTAVPGVTGDAQGGAINIGSSVVATITNSSFENNSARDGGAISVSRPVSVTFAAPGGTLIVSNTVFSNNTATRTGGAIYDMNPIVLTVSQDLFQGNSAGTNGGAIEINNTNDGVPIPFPGGTASVSNSVFINNSAVDGGAISYEYVPTTGSTPTLVNISNDGFLGNSAKLGDAYYQSGGVSTVTGNVFADQLCNNSSSEIALNAVPLNAGLTSINGLTTAPGIINSLVHTNYLLDSDDIVIA